MNAKQIISETVGSRNGDDAIREAVNRLLGEDITAGATVVSIQDDSAFPYQGVRGIAKGPSAKGSGFTDVQFPDGTVVPLQTSLLLKQ